MYEEYFRFSGLPFQLSPDPTYYYSSEGHRRALSYLKYGVYQGEGFVVVTGEIGAGKTTLVRALIGELDASKIVAAQLVSTQLGASDVLRSVLATFGLPVKGSGKAEMLHTIEAFLTSLFVEGKRAILIVDEAQNLPPDAIEELRMLSNFQIQDRGLLQSLLVGQPELRDMLRSTRHEQLRQRIIASYHLGAMSLEDTKGYVTHRLACVGWDKDPEFDAEAFEQIFRYTGGVPRKINRLCNRLLLATYLAGSHRITADDVSDVANEIGDEIGADLVTVRPAKKARASASGNAANRAPAGAQSGGPDSAGETSAALGPDNVVGLHPSTDSARVAAKSKQTFDIRQGSVLCAADTVMGVAAMGQICRAWAKVRGSAPTALVWLNEQSAGDAPDWEAFGLVKPQAVVLPAGGAAGAGAMSALLATAESLLESARPPLVVLQGDSDLVLALALAAHQARIAVARLDAGLRVSAGRTDGGNNAPLIDRLATHLFASEASALERLERESIASNACEMVGNPLIDALVTALPRSVPPVDLLARHGLPASALTAPAGYTVVDVQLRHAAHDATFAEVASILASVSSTHSLVWLVTPDTQARLESLFNDSANQRCALLPMPAYFETLALLSEAALVLTDSEAWQAEATALGVPCLTLGQRTPFPVTVELGTNTLVKVDKPAIEQLIERAHSGGASTGRIPDKWDAKSAARIVQTLSQTLKLSRPAGTKARA